MSIIGLRIARVTRLVSKRTKPLQSFPALFPCSHFCATCFHAKQDDSEVSNRKKRPSHLHMLTQCKTKFLCVALEQIPGTLMVIIWSITMYVTFCVITSRKSVFGIQTPQECICHKQWHPFHQYVYWVNMNKWSDTTAVIATRIWVLWVISGEDGNHPVQPFLAAFQSRVFSCYPSLTHTPTVPHLHKLRSNTVIFLQPS